MPDAGTISTLAALVFGSISAWLAIRQYRDKAREADSTALNAVMSHAQSLSQMLMNERKDREAEIVRLRDEMEALRGELHERGERIEALEGEYASLWAYTGQLESLVRDGGLTLPTRPELYEIPPYSKLGRQKPKPTTGN